MRASSPLLVPVFFFACVACTSALDAGDAGRDGGTHPGPPPAVRSAFETGASGDGPLGETARVVAAAGPIGAVFASRYEVPFGDTVSLGPSTNGEPLPGGLGLVVAGLASPNDWTWQRVVHRPIDLRVRGMAGVPGGGAVLVAEAQAASLRVEGWGPSLGGLRVDRFGWVIRYTEHGDVDWAFATVRRCSITDVAVLPDENSVVAVETTASRVQPAIRDQSGDVPLDPLQRGGVHLVAYGRHGQHAWTEVVGADVRGVHLASGAHGLVVAGTFATAALALGDAEVPPLAPGRRSAFVASWDPGAGLRWVLRGVGSVVPTALDVGGGRVVVAARVQRGDGPPAFETRPGGGLHPISDEAGLWVASLDAATGALRWSREANGGTDQGSRANAVLVDADGRVVLAGAATEGVGFDAHARMPAGEGSAAFVAAFADDGDVDWWIGGANVGEHVGDARSSAEAVAPRADGGLLIALQTRGPLAWIAGSSTVLDVAPSRAPSTHLVELAPW